MEDGTLVFQDLSLGERWRLHGALIEEFPVGMPGPAYGGLLLDYDKGHSMPQVLIQTSLPIAMGGV